MEDANTHCKSSIIVLSKRLTDLQQYVIVNLQKEMYLHERGLNMGTEAERQDTRKAMAFDLINIIDEKPEQETYTAEEIKKLIRVYVNTADQK